MILDTARHTRALQTSTAITATLRRMYWPECLMLTPAAVIRLLNRAKVGFVLMGTYGMTGWRSEERATEDVDVLIRVKDHRKAVLAVQKAYPDLVMVDQIVVTRFSDPATGKVILDLMKPTERILKAVFTHSVAVGRTHRIPNLEMALAVKYAAMVSPNRPARKKHLDAGDFMDMVERNAPKINRARLHRFAELVYPGGGDEILEYVDDTLAGRTLEL